MRKNVPEQVLYKEYQYQNTFKYTNKYCTVQLPAQEQVPEHVQVSYQRFVAELSLELGSYDGQG